MTGSDTAGFEQPRARPTWKAIAVAISVSLVVMAGALEGQTATAPASAGSACVDSAVTPRSALLRSALLPGWGQYSNDRPARAILFGASAGAFLAGGVLKVRDLDRIGDRARLARDELRRATDEGGSSDITALRLAVEELEGAHEDGAARRNTYFLGLFATITFAALEAFVDAHLSSVGERPRIDILPGADGLSARLTWKASL